ncbi:multidrug efflux RND transporter permease subunit [Pseudoduganella plicata]|uniref:Efflux pump membrane transporter n=1 Tax=Pseudoduganella plicata TaxID=321984 RepID=A0A4V1AT97_9BURK|nr:multidrug efflux RND transporter permease subunit [Pseudoduganella plicata]QBQ34908.1 multidrug efflux RND transporter permease subunit [Pseudoduganella plicata]GGY89529.1 multidrug efflux RND transporter permease subunit [Pseudoduganella plicata]
MLSRFFIERPVLAWVLAIVLMLAGGVALWRMPVAQYPDIAPPVVRVAATYPGASATVVENAVTQVLEQELKGVEGLLYFDAASNSSGEAELMLTFRQGLDPVLAQLQVQNKVNQVTYRLPRAVQQNGLSVSALQNSFLMVAVFADRSGRRSDADIADWMSGQVVDAVSRVPGVGQIRNFGAPYAMRVWLDPHKLHNYGLMPGDVIDAIEAQNTEVPVGELGARPSAAGQQLNVTVTALSRLRTPQQFRALVVKTAGDGAAVRLEDVARVEIGSENYGSTSRLDGLPASGFAVLLAPGANALTTAAGVRARIAALAFPPGVEVTYPEDATRFVKRSIAKVAVTLLEAVVLVGAVMFLFLGGWRATLVPLVTVPVVLLGTCAVLAACGYSVNTLTLFGMVLAIGLLVDDSIVVVENVERTMREEGLDERAATLVSMRGIGGALAGIALVLGAVFVPMAFFPGSVGVIYRQFAVTLVTAMALSVIVAVVLTPVLCASLLRPAAHAAGGLHERLQRRYNGVLGRMLGRPLRWLLVYGGLLALAAYGYVGLPTAFLPEDDQGTVMVKFALPPGAPYERTAALAAQVERHFLGAEKANVDNIFTIAGFGNNGGGQNAGMAFVNLKAWEARAGGDNTAQAIAARATTALATVPDARVFAMVPPPIDGLGQAGGLEFWLQDAAGEGPAVLAATAAKLSQQAGELPGMMYVDADGAIDAPQLRIDIDQVRARTLGLDLDDVNAALGAAWGGVYVNDFIDRGRIRRVLVQADAPYRAAPEDLQHWFVRGTGGAMTPLTAFSATRWDAGPGQLRRFNGMPAVQMSAAAAPGASSGPLMDGIEALAAKQPGTALAWSGLSYQDRLSAGQAPLLYCASILFVFLCLAALYGSWSIPFSVLLAIPLGVLGAVAGAWLGGMGRDIFFQVGVLTTVGLSAKNAILIVEFAEHARRAGSTALAAVTHAAAQRLRPIVMTSLAFGAGIVPLLLASGPGAAAQRAIGASVLGGVLSATVLGVFLIPLCYLLVARLAPRAPARAGATSGIQTI